MTPITRHPIPQNSKMTTIIQTVSGVFNQRVENVKGACRECPLVEARFATWLILHDMGFTNGEIAKEFGCRDLGTIRNGLSRGRGFIETNRDYALKMRECLKQLTTIKNDTKQ